MAMPFAHLTDPVHLLRQRALAQLAGIGAEAHRAAFIVDGLLVGHEMNDRVRRLRIELRAVRTGKSCDVARKLDRGALHSQADSQNGDLQLSQIILASPCPIQGGAPSQNQAVGIDIARTGDVVIAGPDRPCPDLDIARSRNRQFGALARKLRHLEAAGSGDDRLDSIRGFDPETQRSAERITGVRLLLLDIFKIPVLFSLGVVAAIIATSIILSLKKETCAKGVAEKRAK